MTSDTKNGHQPGGSSKSSQVRALLATGMSVQDIVTRVGCTPGLVSVVKWNMKKAGKPVRAQAAAPATRNHDGLAGIVEMVKNTERERMRLRGALEKIQAVLADALA